MRATILTLLLVVPLGALSGACGGGEPEAEATWETHTTAPAAGGGGGEDEEDAPSEAP